MTIIDDDLSYKIRILGEFLKIWELLEIQPEYHMFGKNIDLIGMKLFVWCSKTTFGDEIGNEHFTEVILVV